MLDLGTGTGRLLELFAPQFVRGVGVDMSREMLAIARANFDRASLTNVQVRHGDIYAPPVDRESFDLITIHQVLHYLDDPARAIAEAARLLRPAGRLSDGRGQLRRFGRIGLRDGRQESHQGAGHVNRQGLPQRGPSLALGVDLGGALRAC